MPPGEEDDEELVDDVRVGYVEVMFERGDVDEAADLQQHVSNGNENSHITGNEIPGVQTFCSTYSCPCLKAVWPN